MLKSVDGGREQEQGSKGRWKHQRGIEGGNSSLFYPAPAAEKKKPDLTF
jgi:hypothetical protein